MRKSAGRWSVWWVVVLGAGCAPPVDLPADGSVPDARTEGDAAMQDGALAPDAGGCVTGRTIPEAAAPGAVQLDGLVHEVAVALCGALFRCCDDDAARARFFAPMRQSERLGALRAGIPESGALEPAACVPLVEAIYAVQPLGDWVRAAQAGELTFRSAEADACLTTLRTAACGAPLAAAVEDGTCFGFAAPSGGAEQRRAFSRTRGVGEACGAIADGVGASFFGSCDPSRAFCCVDRGATCVPATLARGTCHAAAGIGERCGFAPLVLCQTGLECGDADTCLAPSRAPLALGATCADATRFFGDCTEGFCDFGGTKTCLPRAVLGAPCTSGEGCVEGAGCVSGTCVAETFCRADCL